MNHLSRRSFLSAAGVSATLPHLLSEETSRRPNILFICSDQHSGSAVGANGHPIVHTPNLDRLAASGTNFQAAYCGSPVCAPSRASLMTGLYASDVNSYCNSTPFDGHVATWANRLRNAGYDCWATGKLDLWEHKDLGFREFETVSEHSSGPDIGSLFRAPVCFRANDREMVEGKFGPQKHEDDRRTENAIRFLQNLSPASTKPWCAWVGFTRPHPKFKADAKYEQMYPPATMPLPQWPEDYLEERHTAFQILANYHNVQVPIPSDRIRRAKAAYYGMITTMDEQVGKILDALDRSGQRDNTVIIYTSDHGEMLGEHGLWLKNTLLENASRIPLIVSGPGFPKNKVITTPISQVDFIATLMEISGASTSGLRGHSLRSLLRGDTSAGPVFAYSESHSEGNCTGSFLIRKGQWSYIYFTSGEPLLFDLSQPMGEFRNLAKEERFSPVRRELHVHLTSVVDPDAITFQAFGRQREVLLGLARSQSKEEFYKTLVGRLGSMQASILSHETYTQINKS